MSPTRKSAARKAGRKRARKTTRRPARKAVRKAARKAVRKGTRRPARKAARRSARKAARGPVRGSARKTARRAAKPRLRVVRSARPARVAKQATTPPEAFPQRWGASAKQVVLFELIRARAAVLAAIQGLLPGAASQPMESGKWSVREVVLHLVTRDQARLRESESAQRGQTASWKEISDDEADRLNEELLAPIRHLDWEEALRLLHRTRQHLMEEVESVPEEPAELWGAEHPFGWMLQALPGHDRHHADIIKRWRSERAV